jgi:hypothetical protein
MTRRPVITIKRVMTRRTWTPKMANAQTRGWGPPCDVPKLTLVRSDGLRLPTHRDIRDLVAMLIDLTELMGYDVLVGQTWGGLCRKISGTNVWSNHAWWLAIDLNAPSNSYASAEWHRRNARGTRPFGLAIVCDIPQAVIELWEAYGFFWGGRYKSKPDPMHMEFMQTPAEAKRLTAKLRKWIADNGSAPAPAPIPLPPDPDEEDDMKPRTIHETVPPDGKPYTIALPPWDRAGDYGFKRCVLNAASDLGPLDAGDDVEPMNVRVACLAADGAVTLIKEDLTNSNVEKARGLTMPAVDIPKGTRMVNVQNMGNVRVGICIEMMP